MATEDGAPKNEMGSAEKKKKKKKVEEKWVTHYSSKHRILLVGEGDFSFSLSLANAFGSASNICASSLDSYDALIKKYKQAKSNSENLKKLGASLLHEVDATTMKHHTDLAKIKFDRIIFSFPHAGFYGKEDSFYMIQLHRILVRGFFWNARGMLRAKGEIHVNHKNTIPFCYWNLEELASGNSLVLVNRVNFNKDDYPGYRNKRGHGSRCDEPFPLGESSTFKFRFSCRVKVSKATTSLGSMPKISQGFQNMLMQMQLQPFYSDLNYPQINHHMNQIPLHAGMSVVHSNHGIIMNDMSHANLNRNQNTGVLHANLNGMVHTYRGQHYDVPYSVPGRMSLDLDVARGMSHGIGRQIVEVPRTLNDDLYYLHELHRISNLRSCQAYKQNASNPQEWHWQHW